METLRAQEKFLCPLLNYLEELELELLPIITDYQRYTLLTYLSIWQGKLLLLTTYLLSLSSCNDPLKPQGA